MDAVSYTHLDVYKRQGKEVPVWGNAEGLQDADRKRIVEILDGLDGKKEWYPDFESVTDMGKDKKQDGSCVYFLFDGEAARLYVEMCIRDSSNSACLPPWKGGGLLG